MSILTDEPALITGFVSAVMILLVAFGVPITDDQRTAVLGLFAAGVALAGSILVRAKSTPNSRVDAIVRTVQTAQPDPTMTAVDATTGQGA